MTAPATAPHTRLPVSDQVLERVFGRIEHAPSGCWLWTGSRNSAGYPTIKVSGQVVLVTRLVLAACMRRFRKGELACHGCDTRRCIRPHPDHVRHGTPSSNQRERWARRKRTKPVTFLEDVA